MADPVTDPELLKILNGGAGGAAAQPVNDPALLAMLNGTQAAPAPVPNVSTPDAIGRGAASGLTLGWNDEMQGALAAGDRNPNEPPTGWNLVKGMYRLATGDQNAKAKYTDARNVARSEADAAKTAHPYAFLGGELAGSVPTALLAPVGGASSTLGNIGRGVATGAALGAVQGAGEANEASNIPSEAASGALAGGVIGGVVPAAAEGVRRMITPVAHVDPARQAMVDALRKEGVDLTAGQVTGSKPLRYFESSLGDMPGAGEQAKQAMERQQSQFTAAALRRMGVDADRATPDVLSAGKEAISKTYEDLAARNKLKFDQQFGSDLGSAAREYDKMLLPTAQKPVVGDTINDIVNVAANGGTSLDGTMYQAMRSRLGKQAKALETNDPPTSQALYTLRNALDGAMERSISPQDAGAWQEAKGQWRNWKAIEKAATGAGENAALGMISPSQLRNAVVAQGRGRYAVGNGDLTELARAGEAVMKPLPNSGTAPRAHAEHVISGLAAALAGMGASGSGTTAALAGLGGLAAPALAGRAIYSKPVQAYLQNQALPGPLTPTGRRLAEALLSAPMRQDVVGQNAGR